MWVFSHPGCSSSHFNAVFCVVKTSCSHTPATRFWTLRFGELCACFFTDDVILLPSLHGGCQFKLDWFAAEGEVEGSGQRLWSSVRKWWWRRGLAGVEVYLSVSWMLFCQDWATGRSSNVIAQLWSHEAFLRLGSDTETGGSGSDGPVNGSSS